MNLHSLNNSEKKFCQCLYESLYPLLLKRAITILRDEDVARDIVQETFVALFGKVDKLRTMTPQQQAAYAVTAVKNNALKYIKKYRSSEALVMLSQYADIADIQDDATDDLLETVMREANRAELWKAADDGLTEREQRILQLTYLYNLSDRETAAQMGIKYATFRKDKSRAKAKLQKLMRRRMLDE